MHITSLVVKLQLNSISHFVNICPPYKTTVSDKFQHLRKGTYMGQKKAVYASSKLNFKAFQRFPHYTRTKTDKKFPSSYSQRAQNSGSNPQFFDSSEIFSSGPKMSKHFVPKLSDHPLSYFDTSNTRSRTIKRVIKPIIQRVKARKSNTFHGSFL